MTENGADKPYVSIIVPVYNGERTIQACIESLVAQNYPRERYEVIVVDNNSSDRTSEIVSRFPVDLIYEREVQTSYAARNTGIRQAQGEIVAFTDADCIADSQWLCELVTPFADSRVAGVGGKTLDSSPTTRVEEFLCKVSLFGNYMDENVFLPVLFTNNVAYRRISLDEAGLFNQRLYTGSDVDLAWRIQIASGAKIACVEQAIIYHKHRATLSSMAKQFRRLGFGEILLDASYHDYPGYQRTLRRQTRILASQVRALFTYTFSFIYRLLTYRFRGKDSNFVTDPLLWIVAESANIYGKIQGLIATRLMTLSPTQQTWEDPGER